MKLNKVTLLIALGLNGLILICTSSCANSKPNKLVSSFDKKISHKIVSERLSVWANSKNVFIDSFLIERSTVFNRHGFQDASKLFPTLLYPKKDSDSCIFIIPDSLSSRVKYKKANADIENGSDTYLFFSPLLATKRKSVFAIQVYKIETLYDHEVTIRLAERYYELFEKRKHSFKYLEMISSDEDVFSLPFHKFD